MAVFIGLKAQTIAPRFSDGNTYLYLGKLIASGALPYADFFYSSPPLLLLLSAAYGSIFDFTWQAFGWLPVLLTGAEVWFLWLLMRDRYAPVASWAAIALYLSSYLVLTTTDFVTDIHFVLVLTLAGLACVDRARRFAGGLLLGLATLTKLYAVVFWAPLLAVYCWRRQSREAARFAAGFGVGFVLPMLVLLACFGAPFYHQLFTSHFGAIVGRSKLEIVRILVVHDPAFVLGLLLASVFVRRLPLVVALPALGSAILYLGYKDIHYLYFKPLMAWLAFGFAAGVDWLATRRDWRVAARVAATLVIAAGAHSTWRYLTEQRVAAVITPLAAIVEAVRQQTSEGEPIYGERTLAPLIALLAERPIFKNHVDVHPKFFATGFFDYATRERELLDGKLGTIITKANVKADGKVSAGPERVLTPGFFEKHCAAAAVFPVAHDYSHSHVIVWRCR